MLMTCISDSSRQFQPGTRGWRARWIKVTLMLELERGTCRILPVPANAIHSIRCSGASERVKELAESPPTRTPGVAYRVLGHRA
jgi:hypothetical protein